MSLVRVFVPTYRRHSMLQRAVASLRAQTFADWVCEVHNDDPNDESPESLVVSLGDERIKVVNHSRRLGGAANMNQFYAPAQERFVSILEDDNWWEPEFLEEMVKAANLYPERKIFWSNMRVWQEGPDGNFSFSGKTVHPPKGAEYEEFRWPDPQQIMGAVHSNGSCLIRTGLAADYRIPSVPFSTIEMFRERAFPHPMILVRRPLANFSVTLSTERSADGQAYGEALAVLAASFFGAADLSDEALAEMMQRGRRNSPPPTHTLLNAALLEPKARALFRMATISELLRWMASLVRRPLLFGKLLMSRRIHADWWTFLSRHTAERFTESRAAVSEAS